MSRVMKDSGIEWIGKIPEDWNKVKIKYRIESIKSGGTPTSSNSSFYSDDGVNWVSIADMPDFGYVYATKKRVTIEGIKNKNLKVFEPGTVIYSIYATLGLVSELKECATINQAILAIKEQKSINKQFLKYNLKTMEDYVLSLSSGNTQFNLNLEKFKNLYIIDLNLKKQAKIVNFLDEKCEIIDKQIENNKKSIELLEEYKESLIYIKTTNENWKDTTFKRYVYLNQGLQINQNLRFEGPGKGRYLYITIKYLNSDKTNSEYIEEPPQSVICKKDDILVARTGATGKVISGVEGVFHNNFFRVNYDKRLEKRFLRYYLERKSSQEYMLLAAGSTTIPDLNHSAFLSMRLQVPPIEEQKEIADYLDDKCSKIDKVIEYRKQIIEKLEEYKKSLIYEAVTGKIEV